MAYTHIGVNKEFKSTNYNNKEIANLFVVQSGRSGVRFIGKGVYTFVNRSWQSWDYQMAMLNAVKNANSFFGFTREEIEELGDLREDDLIRSLEEKIQDEDDEEESEDE